MAGMVCTAHLGATGWVMRPRSPSDCPVSLSLRAALTVTYTPQHTPLQPCVAPSTRHRANAVCFLTLHP